MATRQNLCTNPSFETGTSGWSGISAPALVRVTDQSPPAGGACLRVATDGSSSSEGVRVATSAVTSEDVVTASAYVKAPAGTSMRLRLGDGIGTTTRAFKGTGLWQRLSVTRILAPSPSFAELAVILNGSASITYYVDGCLIERAPLLGSYFDGDHPDADWDGAAHASTSTYTDPVTPVPATGAATELTASSATLNGTVDPNGSETAYWFEYGETTAYGAAVPASEDGDAGSGADMVAVDESVFGLAPATTYHYRLVASSAQGTVVGEDAAFTTLGAAFTGTFDTGDTSEWDAVQAIPGRLTVVTSPKQQGTHAGRFEVRGGDVEPQTGAQRCEVISGLLYHDGDERYFRILARVDSWDEDAWGLIWQLHDNSTGGPPVALFIEGDELKLQDGAGSPVYWRNQEIDPFDWFEVVVRVVFSNTGGLIEVWLDGVKQTLVGGVQTRTGLDTLGIAPCYDKLGVYRSSTADATAVVYHDAYQVSEQFFSSPPSGPKVSELTGTVSDQPDTIDDYLTA